jgi:hypothetical protein
MNTPAFPSARALATASGVMTEGHAGLTKREFAALMAMQGVISGILSNHDQFPNIVNKTIAELSVSIADETLKALEGGK